MTAAEIAAQLALVNAAINSILTGTAQSVSIGGRSYTSLNLMDLYAIQSLLEAKAAAAAAGGVRPGVVRFV